MFTIFNIQFQQKISAEDFDLVSYHRLGTFMCSFLRHLRFLMVIFAMTKKNAKYMNIIQVYDLKA